MRIIERMSFPIDINNRTEMLNVVNSCIATKFTHRFGMLIPVRGAPLLCLIAALYTSPRARTALSAPDLCVLRNHTQQPSVQTLTGSAGVLSVCVLLLRPGEILRATRTLYETMCACVLCVVCPHRSWLLTQCCVWPRTGVRVSLRTLTSRTMPRWRRSLGGLLMTVRCSKVRDDRDRQTVRPDRLCSPHLAQRQAQGQSDRTDCA